LERIGVRAAREQRFCPDSNNTASTRPAVHNLVDLLDRPRELSDELDAVFSDPEQLIEFCHGRPMVQSRPLDVTFGPTIPS
jgi:hypothetical protein